VAGFHHQYYVRAGDHPLRQLRLCGAPCIGLRYQLACTQDCHPVGHAQYLGQFVAGSAGAPEQTQRDNIKNLQSTLIQSIKNLSDMGAKQLDSNFELQNALRTLGNVGQSEQTIKTTLDTIRRIYAEAEASLPDDAATPGAAAKGGKSKEVRWDDM
jgi:hypothetical protein